MQETSAAVNASAETDFTAVAVYASGPASAELHPRIDGRFLAVCRHGNMDMLPSAGRLPLGCPLPAHSLRMAIQ
jgi:hypothetical protein